MKIAIQKRERLTLTSAFLNTLVSVLGALVFGGVVLTLISGVNPLTAYLTMAVGAFGSGYAITEILVKAIPLMILSLAVSLAFRIRFWNIGAEGQWCVGGIAATGIGLFWSSILPGPLVLPVMFLGSFVLGALWALIPAILKVWLKVNEVITTLMMNYIAVLLVEHFYLGPWKNPGGWGFPGTASVPAIAQLPKIAGRAHFGLVFAVAAAFLIWIILKKTTWGFRIRVIGESERAARYSGYNVPKYILVVTSFSGGLAAIAGMAEIAGVAYKLQMGYAVGYGFTAIIVAWLAKLNPWAVLVTAFLLAALLVGGDQLQISLNLSSYIALVMQGVVLFFILAGEYVFSRYSLRISWR